MKQHTITKSQKVPKGWLLKPFDEIAEINPKKSNEKIDDELNVSFIPMKCVEELTGNVDLSNTRKYHDVRTGYTYFKNNDIVFAKITPCMENGKIAIVNDLENGMGFGSTEFHVIRLKLSELSQKFYFYYIIQKNFRNLAKKNMRGTAGQLRVDANYLKNILVPIPPADEQKRIVEKIEKLLLQVNSVKKSLELTKPLFEQYKQSLLQSMFDQKISKSWTNVILGDICDLISGKSFKKSEYSKKGLKLFQISNVSFGKTSWDNIEYLPENYENDYPNLMLKEGDLVMAMNRPFKKNQLKIALLKKNDMPSILYQRVGKFELSTDVLTPFFYYYLQSPAVIIKLQGLMKGVDQPFINKTELLKIPFYYPSKTIQEKIVSKIARGFALIENTENITNSLLNQVNMLNSSVLENAFQGKLVSQDSNEDSSDSLLEKIKNIEELES